MNTMFLRVCVYFCIFVFGTQDFSDFADMKVQWSEGQIMRKRCKLNIIELLCTDEIGFLFRFHSICII